METVLIVGATGNIGVSAVHAVLHSGRQVLAIVRNRASAEKLFAHVGTHEGIITVEADIMTEDGVQSVVEQVKTGKLPAFQHVWASAGGAYAATALENISLADLREAMRINFETNFLAYRATVPYLRKQNFAHSTWTVCTGSQGDLGHRAAPAVTAGPLISMATVACRDNMGTNVRFNEVWVNGRVEVDSSAEKTGAMKASEFAKVYEELLGRPEIDACRVRVTPSKGIGELEFTKKVA